MLTGIFLLVACLSVGVVAFWMMANDTVAPDKPTRGLLAMPEPPASKPAATDEQKYRGQGGGCSPRARS